LERRNYLLSLITKRKKELFVRRGGKKEKRMRRNEREREKTKTNALSFGQEKKGETPCLSYKDLLQKEKRK